MDDITETGEKFVKGLKQVPSQHTGWIVAGATVGLLIGVMAMSSMFAGKPSWTPKIPFIGSYFPVPPGGY